MYLREFVRLLRRDGVLVFQLPSHPRGADDPLPESTAIAMAEDAYQAQIAMAALPEAPVEPGASITLDVEVTNISGTAWTQQLVWRDPVGKPLARSGRRADAAA